MCICIALPPFANTSLELLNIVHNFYYSQGLQSAQGTSSGISYNDTSAVATQLTWPTRKGHLSHLLSLVARQGALSPWVNDSLMAKLVKQGMIRER